MQRPRCLSRAVLGIIASIALLATAAYGQQISGSITGIVRDSQQAVIAGAKVTLIDQAQGSSRTLTSGSDGAFVFTPVQPGTYTVAIEAPGFKKFEQRDVKLFASDRVTLGDLVMAVGQLT